SIIGYADGNFQRFPSGTDPIAEGDFNSAEPDGDVFTRATPFSSQFLFNFSGGELPTAIVMSRGEGVYLFADGGIDNLGQQADGILSAEAADVTGILVGAVSPTQPPVEPA